MDVRRKSDGAEFWLCAVSREVQHMPSRGWMEVVTWFLIWDVLPSGVKGWTWVKADDFEPYNSGF